MTMADRREHVDRVAETMERTTALIVEAIERGLARPEEWEMPWHNRTVGLPVNVATGATYQGGNLFLLWSLASEGASRYWGTFNQWRDLARPDAPVCVRKGERATAYVLRPRTLKRTDESTGEESVRVIGFSAHAVFHAGQVDGWLEPTTEPVPHVAADHAADIATAFRWSALTGATIVESDTRGASYSPVLDVVTMPARERFTSGHGCWSTLAHELTHWTGHESRLARTFGKRFGDDAYAAEELCAELGAAFTLATIGRSTEPRPDHGQYLAHWLRVLREDPSALWTVAGKASKAAEYLTDRVGRIGVDVAAGLAAA
jgi:antirestriction protein ArdC